MRLLVMAAMTFCAQSESFPVFQRFAIEAALERENGNENSISRWLRELDIPIFQALCVAFASEEARYTLMARD